MTKEEFTKMLNTETELTDRVEKIKEQLFQQISNEPTTANPFGSGNISAYTVKMTDIAKNDFILSPEYYIPSAQAKAVRADLKYKTSISEVAKAIEKMISTKRGNKVPLNPETIKILKGWIKDE